ncbi:PREDICTED: uncharacterized protein LOC106814784 [Priapulus caudatus]|uniref:Uncharacterized protein LOC106814784 n=1 Tax=Priapulus caudatus TaxID=37621 RepID=A0ABM1ER01_PRICU|nr:PREDICTED: uncharacterized protein LOC106814784 [Priapulus caudatus]
MAAQATQPGKNRDEYCCVLKCNSNGRINNELSFHHIPSMKRQELRKLWIIAIRRDEGPLFKVNNKILNHGCLADISNIIIKYFSLLIGSNTVECSRHFQKSDFRCTLNRKCLKPGAVPSIFEWKIDVPGRKSPKTRLSHVTEGDAKTLSNCDDAADMTAVNE